MTYINSSSQSSSYSNRGLSGLVSGIDTEKMVSDMLSGTQTKIDKTSQDKQVLLWKQEMYRGIISSLNTFQSKFFSFGNEKTNLLSRSFYSTMNATVTGTSMTVVASSTATTAPITVDYVTRLATQSKITATETAMGSLKGTFSKDNLDNISNSRYLSVSVGEIEATILIKGTSESSIISNLNSELERNFGEDVISASVIDGTFVLKSVDSEQTIRILEDSGTTALEILGLTAGEEKAGEISGKFDEYQANDYLTITLDGISKNIEINLSAADIEEFASDLQQEINRAFGNSISVSVSDGVIEFTPTRTDYDEFGNPVVSTDKARQIILSGSNHIMDVFGMRSGQSNKIALGMELGEIDFQRPLIGKEDPETGEVGYGFTINGVEFSFSSKDTLSSVISKVNASDASVNITYSSLEDRFVMTSKEYGAGFNIEMQDSIGSNLLNSLFGDGYVYESGRNAVLSINGIETQRSSNTFSVDGVTVTLNETTDKAEIINVSRNTEQIVDGIIEFVDEYNKLVEELTGMIKAKPVYRDYPPLTSAQKKEMSEREIELWEEKAKEGLLSNDPTIYRLLERLRSTLYSRVPGSSYALYDLGIETSSLFRDNGKLVINDRAKLLKAIEADPESIYTLFTDGQNGIATSINNILNSTIKVSYGGSGSLVQLAGTAAFSGSSSLDRQIEQMENKLKELQKRYDAEKTRYWNQFNKMEELISTMNQQSSWLYSMFYN
jgi:flagellar hook-associated protein 2